MKIRTGFVSNSSSSSFICDVCGKIESGWDLCPSEVSVLVCEKDHCFHESESKTEFPEDWDELDEFCEHPYEIPKKYCPICSLEYIESETVLFYLSKKMKFDIEETKKEIRKQFNNTEELMRYVNEN